MAGRCYSGPTTSAGLGSASGSGVGSPPGTGSTGIGCEVPGTMSGSGGGGRVVMALSSRMVPVCRDARSGVARADLAAPAAGVQGRALDERLETLQVARRTSLDDTEHVSGLL